MPKKIQDLTKEIQSKVLQEDIPELRRVIGIAMKEVRTTKDIMELGKLLISLAGLDKAQNVNVNTGTIVNFPLTNKVEADDLIDNMFGRISEKKIKTLRKVKEVKEVKILPVEGLKVEDDEKAKDDNIIIDLEENDYSFLE